MNDEQLQRACEIWQKRLRLQDWKISAMFSRPGELVEADDFGNIFIQATHKWATIHIRRPEEMETGVHAHDEEHRLLHELLHLHFHQVDDNLKDHQTQQLEQAINCIADALAQRVIPLHLAIASAAPAVEVPIA